MKLFKYGKSKPAHFIVIPGKKKSIIERHSLYDKHGNFVGLTDISGIGEEIIEEIIRQNEKRSK